MNIDGAQSLRPDKPRTAEPDVGALSVTVAIARNARAGTRTQDPRVKKLPISICRLRAAGSDFAVGRLTCAISERSRKFGVR
jgi:hypothetical protein